MSALTKRQMQQLRAILSNVKRANNYLKSDKVAGIAHGTVGLNGSTYVIHNPACVDGHYITDDKVQVMSKWTGSDITGVYEALRLLEEWVKNPELKITTTDQPQE